MKKSLPFLLSISLAPVCHSAPLELQTYWSSKSEQAALNIVINEMKSDNPNIISSLVKGAGGLNNYILLQRQIVAQQLPDIAQLEGPTIKEWAQMGLLNHLPSNVWFSSIPSVLKDDLLYENEFVAIPVALHRTNTLWLNPKPFKKLNLPIPETFNEFLTDLDILQKAGYIPLAFSQEDWQEASLFENILLSTQGTHFYNQIFVQQNPSAILSHNMTTTLLLLRHVYQFADKDYTKRSWPMSTELFAKNKAAMMMGGDWIKGELRQQGLNVNKDFLCFPLPGTDSTFVYNVDSFGFIRKNPSLPLNEEQKKLISQLTSTKFQIEFNLAKGSIPAKIDLPLTQFDTCAQQEQHDFIAAEKNHSVIPSMANSMATNTQKKMVFFNVLHHFLQHPEQTPQQAQSQLNAAFSAIGS